jgi:hypothetical protein
MSAHAPISSRPRQRPIPPLQSGDHLTAEEFERRFDATPDLTKAELIDGVVYMPPPVSDEYHAGPHFDVIGWLATYRATTPGVVGGDNGTYGSTRETVVLRMLPECGGQSTRDADGYLTTGPEFIFEVAASSASHDLHEKFDLYRRHDVREYVVWRVYEEAIDWFALHAGGYHRLQPGPDGVFRSEVFPCLWLDGPALVRGDLGTVLRVLQEGVATPDHAQLVARLAAARTTRPTAAA